jgi:hypothetical protein
LLRLALNRRKTEVLHLNKVYCDYWYILFNLSQGQTQEDIANKLKSLENKISDKITSKSKKKFMWLNSKQKPRQHSDTVQITINNNRNNEGSDKPNQEKKHKRFIKRSKWKRLQNKKNKEHHSHIQPLQS